MPHRFTEPTPGDHVEVFVPSWEIECCAPAPVVGEPTSWVLRFVALWDLGPELDRHRLWQVRRRDGATWLTDGAVSARWSDHGGPPPEPGDRTVRGSVIGTIHEAGPKVTGTVRRIRFATSRYRPGGARRLEPMPGTLVLTDVSEAPRALFFDVDAAAGAGTTGTDRLRSVGVLLNLIVPTRP